MVLRVSKIPELDEDVGPAVQDQKLLGLTSLIPLTRYLRLHHQESSLDMHQAQPVFPGFPSRPGDSLDRESTRTDLASEGDSDGTDEVKPPRVGSKLSQRGAATRPRTRLSPDMLSIGFNGANSGDTPQSWSECDGIETLASSPAR
jgi:hypothetical protein